MILKPFLFFITLFLNCLYHRNICGGLAAQQLPAPIGNVFAKEERSVEKELN